MLGAALAPAAGLRRLVVAGAASNRRHPQTSATRILRYPDGSQRMIRYPTFEAEEAHDECKHGESSLWSSKDVAAAAPKAGAAPAAEPQRVGPIRRPC
jgi:hypothetical protein